MIDFRAFAQNFRKPIAWLVVSCAVAIGAHSIRGFASTAPVDLQTPADDSSLVGQWSGPYHWPVVAAHAVLLDTGKVLVWSDGNQIQVWDPATDSLTRTPNASSNISGAGHAIQADGTPMIIGGTSSAAYDVGIADTSFFNVSAEAPIWAPSLTFPRWRPTATVLGDGRVLASGGSDSCRACAVLVSEIYEAAARTWTPLARAESSLGEYPFMFVLPDGRVIHAGGSMQPSTTDALDVAAERWSTIDSRVVDGGSAVMYLPGRIMKSGTAATTGMSGPSAPTTWVLDASDAAPAWRPAPTMAYPRAFHNLTLLPDGTVLATGGETARDGADVSKAVLPAERWSATTETWTTMAAAERPRLFQSVGLLLPDGRVLVAGGGAAAGVPDERTAEIFSPPYLFKGPRPTIASAPSTVAYGEPAFVGTADARDIGSVSLIRTGAVSHSFNQDQRFVPVSFRQTSGGLEIAAPSDANVAPPGTYFLFLVNSSGVPSVASFVKLAAAVDAPLPKGSGTTAAPRASALAAPAAAVAGVAPDAVAWGDQGSTTSRTVSTSALSTTAGSELLLAFVAADDVTAGNTVTGVSGGGLTWQLVVRTNAQRGTSEIWRAFAAGPLTNVIVTATLAQAASSSLTVMSFTGADPSGANGAGAIGAIKSASATSGAPTATVTTTRPGSWVVGVGNDWDTAKSRTVGAGQVLTHQYLSPVGDTYWVQRGSAVVAAGGTATTINDSAPTTDRYNLSICEIVAAATDTTPPTVAMSAPAAGATVSGTAVTVTATASDDVGVAGVQFKLDGTTNLGAEDTASPYGIVWNSTTVANGSHTLSAVARDAAGNTTTSVAVSVTVNNSVDATPPTVAMSAPAAGATVSGTAVTVTATASDDVGVAGVQFKLDGTTNLGAEDTASPYGIVWNSTTVANGSHTLSAVARDAAGNTTTSVAVSVTVNNSVDATPPMVAMSAPAGGATVSGTAVTVTATASDNVGVAGVQFKLDGTTNLGAEDTTSPYGIVWNSTTVANGSHTLTAVARDAAGNTATSTAVTFTVNNSTGSVDVAVDGSQRFQAIDGLLANVNTAAWNNGLLKPALDMLLDQGTKVFRVIIDNTDWESTNDNADPNVFNWTYYNTVYTSQKFENFWATIGYLNSKGITSGIALSPMGPGPAWMGGTSLTSGMEDEFVEMIASMIYYGRITRGLQFTLVEPTNEPQEYNEGVEVGAAQYTLILHKLAQKLDSLGLSDIRFYGPDTSTVDVGVSSYMPAMLADSTVMAKLAHFSFHNYGGSSATADSAIKNSAYPDRTLWMTEAGLGNDTWGVDTLFDMLKNDATSTGPWDAYYSVYNHRAADNLTTMIAFDSSTGIFTPTPAFYSYEQLYKFATPGSVRIAAAANGVIATAFLNVATGAVTVVGHNQGSSSTTLRISLTNVPAASTWQYYETSNSRSFQRQPDVTLSNGVASITVDSGGIFTLTTASADTIPPTSPANLNATAGDATVALSWTAATDNVGVAAYNVHRSTTSGFAPSTANRLAQTSNTSYTDTAPAGTYYYVTTAQDAAGNISAPSNEASATIGQDSTPPTVAMLSPADGATVSGVNVTLSAGASDNVGVAGVQFKVDGTTNVGAEDTASPYTIAWDSTTVANGGHTLSAVARDAAGNTTTSAAVSVTVTNADTTPPSVTMSAPAAGATVSGTTVTVSATASDNVGVAGVQFKLDGSNLGTELTTSPYSLSWNTTMTTNGNHSLTAVARDPSGNATTSTAVVVTVNNTDTTPPTIVSTTPATGAASIGTATTVRTAFSEAMNGATLTTSTFVVRDPSNTVLPATISYDAATFVATLTPSQPLSAATTYTATVTGGGSGVKDVAGNALVSNYVWSFTTTSSLSIWSASTAPATVATNDSNAVELGVKLRSDVDGNVTGVRFYKAATNTGTHTGTLWSSTGTRLATATFSGETASGWQQVTFSTPVAITANTTYIVSYHANAGNYAYNSAYFASAGADNVPLHALANGVSANGVYRYGASAFPNSTFNATNYWVDVIFVPK